MSNVIALDEWKPTATVLVAESNHRFGIVVSAIQRQIEVIRERPEVVTREAASAGLKETAAKVVSMAHRATLPIQIEIVCERAKDGRTRLETSDNGVGLAEGFEEMHAGFGLKLIRTPARRIGAALGIESSELELNFRLVLPAHGVESAE